MAISKSRLQSLLIFDLIPIKRIVYPQPKSTHLEDGFPLRCFQRLSKLHVATQHLPLAE